ncbi:MAG: gliding motility protein GldN [Lentimicrobiaceae bacterium]|nr:gliding motility protein GldN [Lentimicrobiaceae bacterium]
MKRFAFSVLMLAALTASVGSLKAQVLEDTPPLDNFFVKENTADRLPREYVYVREADVYIKWRVWRMVDFRMKMNQYLYYPMIPVQDRISLMSLIMKGMEDGSIVAYDAITDDFRKQLTYEEFIRQNTQITELQKEDLDNPGQYITSMDTSSFQIHNVKMIRLKEDWFIDKQRSIRDIRVLGMAPVIQVFDEESGQFKGNQTLFWLYYPSIRPLFAKTETFNRHNSAMRQSYDDVFAWNRWFQSYITKIDNQQDRQIQQYAQGANIMRESERIEEMLFEIEHDLWEY